MYRYVCLPVVCVIICPFPDISLLAAFTGGPMTVPYACTLLEYCLVTGLDWWDLLVSLRPSMMDTVCERFTESFNRQPQQIQQFHYVQFLNIKTSLYRCLEIITLSPTLSSLSTHNYFFMSQLIYLIRPLIFNNLSFSLLIFICDIPLYYDNIIPGYS